MPRRLSTISCADHAAADAASEGAIFFCVTHYTILTRAPPRASAFSGAALAKKGLQ